MAAEQNEMVSTFKDGVRPDDFVCIIDWNSSSIKTSTSGNGFDGIVAMLEDRPPWENSCRWIDFEGRKDYMNQSNGLSISPSAYIFKEFKERDILVRAVQMDPLRVQYLKIQADVFLVTLKLMTYDEQKFPDKMSQSMPVLFEFETVAVLVNKRTQTVTTIQEGKKGDVWSCVRSLLAREGSVLRMADSSLLLWSLVDASTEVYGTFMDYLKHQFDLVCELQSLRSKMWFAGVIKQNAKLLAGELEQHVSLASELMASSTPDSDELYFTDLFSRFKHASQDCNWLILATQDLQDRITQDEEARHAKSSYIISVVLAVFSPLSFITGLYGMNFTGDGQGNGIMPELTWSHGYEFVWALMGSIAFTVLCLFFLFKVLEFPAWVKRGCYFMKTKLLLTCCIHSKHIEATDSDKIKRLHTFRLEREKSIIPASLTRAPVKLEFSL